MSALSCVAMSSILAVHPVNCTVIHKRVPVQLPSRMCGFVIYFATGVPKMGCSLTCLINVEAE